MQREDSVGGVEKLNPFAVDVVTALRAANFGDDEFSFSSKKTKRREWRRSAFRPFWWGSVQTLKILRFFDTNIHRSTMTLSPAFSQTMIARRFLVLLLALLLCFWNSEAFLGPSITALVPTFGDESQVHHIRHRLLQSSLDSNNQDVLASERRNGLLVLVTVPMAWGTFEPAVRYVYEIQPDIPPCE